MEKTFEDAITETLEDLISVGENTEQLQDESDTEDVTVDEENIDENEDDVSDELEESIAYSEDLEPSEEVEVPSTNDKDAKAFARMRVELKEANNIIKFFDERAKKMGLGDVQGLMEKTRESELARQAQEKGIPVDVLKRLDELENKVQQQDFEKEQLQYARKEQEINHIFESFVQKNSLNDKTINNLAKSLADDGFTLEGLMDMPSTAVNKILSSYLPNETVKQVALAKKEQIKKEMPVSEGSSSQINTEDEIDKIAKLWAGN